MRLRKRFELWLEHARADTVCVSYPKCGRTWFRVMLGKAICVRRGLDDQLVFDSLMLSRKAGVAMPIFVHDGAANTEGRHYEALEPDKSKYASKRVLFLQRDPRDVVVSCYFQAAHRKGLYEGSIREFIRDPHYGIRKILTFYEHWERARNVPKGFHLVRYADLHERPHETLAAALRFIGEAIDDRAIDAAIEFASFDEMQRMEKDQYFRSSKLRASNPDDPKSFKTRRGVVGGYVDTLGEEDLKYVDEEIARFGGSFA